MKNRILGFIVLLALIIVFISALQARNERIACIVKHGVENCD